MPVMTGTPPVEVDWWATAACILLVIAAMCVVEWLSWQQPELPPPEPEPEPTDTRKPLLVLEGPIRRPRFKRRRRRPST